MAGEPANAIGISRRAPLLESDGAPRRLALLLLRDAIPTNLNLHSSKRELEAACHAEREADSHSHRWAFALCTQRARSGAERARRSRALAVQVLGGEEQNRLWASSHHHQLLSSALIAPPCSPDLFAEGLHSIQQRVSATRSARQCFKGVKKRGRLRTAHTLLRAYL